MEPGTNAKIKEFVEEKYDGTFPLFAKVGRVEFVVQLGYRPLWFSYLQASDGDSEISESRSYHESLVLW